MSSGNRQWWFLSFADLDPAIPDYLPRFRGVAIVYAVGEDDATRKCARLGAEKGWAIKAQQLETLCPPREYRNRLVKDPDEARIIAESV